MCKSEGKRLADFHREPQRDVYLPTYTLTIYIEGQGDVTHIPAGTVIVPLQSSYYFSGTQVILSANAAAGWHFTGWSGDLSGAVNPVTVTLDADKVITATFALSSTANTPPTISPITDQTTFIGKPVGSISFTIGDAETDLADLTLAGTSSNLALVPSANMVFSGSGANRAVTITPTARASGTVMLTITVSDGALDTGEPFLLTVTPYQVYLPLVQRE